MTNRSGAPDTEADIRLRAILDETPRKSFVMVAGAGSGKTTSLIKALDFIRKTKASALRRRGQRVACITYTEIAAGEIWSDVGNDTLFHVSTIHSFLWLITHSFQNDIRKWVTSRIEERISDLRSEQADLGPRVGQKRRNKIAADLQRFTVALTLVGSVPRFNYGTGGDYEKGILGHDDIIRMAPALIAQHATLRALVAQRFPYVFVDESQDTSPVVVTALKEIARSKGVDFCLGFFGDPMQKIYTSGIGDVRLEPGWQKIEKPENFRCPMRVLSVINNIRADGDSLLQTRGRMLDVDGVSTPVEGTARIFVLPTERRTERLLEVRRWLATRNDDPLWESDDRDADVKVLVIVHRMAASRLGFGELYSALTDDVPDDISTAFADGTFWAVRPFLNVIFPLLQAKALEQRFKVMSLLRTSAPSLAPDRVRSSKLSDILDGLKANLSTLGDMLSPGSRATTGDVLKLVQRSEILELDERFAKYLLDASGINIIGTLNDSDEESPEYSAVTSYLQIPAPQMWNYRTYIEALSPFSTQQGIKGAEFQRVLTILDDEEGRHFQFSYNKYFGITPLSVTDKKHIENGEETQIDRTRRLFYVCCSRAVKDLAVVLFSGDVVLATQRVRESGLFRPEDIIQL
jgi:DNA helicase II / ATP-dependent DNA helicase PcrA